MIPNLSCSLLCFYWMTYILYDIYTYIHTYMHTYIHTYIHTFIFIFLFFGKRTTTKREYLINTHRHYLVKYDVCLCGISRNVRRDGKKERNILLNDALNTFYLLLYCLGPLSYRERKPAAATSATLSD